METVFLKVSLACSKLSALKDVLTSLTALLDFDFWVMFLSLAAWLCLALLRADLWFAKVFSPVGKHLFNVKKFF
jgi:hypothetical protein